MYKRSGDHYLHVVDNVPKDLNPIKHDGKFVFGVGEASNHNHTIIVKDKKDLIIKQDSKGDFYFELLADGELLHLEGDSMKIADHKTIPIKKGIYKQVHEREKDIFSDLIRKVLD